MGKRIDHDKDGKLVQMIEEKSKGLTSMHLVFRTVDYEILYVNRYSGDPYVEIIPRYKDYDANCRMESLISDLISRFNEEDCEMPLTFFIDKKSYFGDEILKKVQKEGINILSDCKIRIYTYEQLEYVLSLDL